MSVRLKVICLGHIYISSYIFFLAEAVRRNFTNHTYSDAEVVIKDWLRNAIYMDGKDRNKSAVQEKDFSELTLLQLSVFCSKRGQICPLMNVPLCFILY